MRAPELLRRSDSHSHSGRVIVEGVGSRSSTSRGWSEHRSPWQRDIVGNPVRENARVRTLSAPLVPAQLQTLRSRCCVHSRKEFGASDITCEVCLEELRPSAKNRCVKIPCGGGHVFHLACIEPWFRKCSICPKCRQPVQIPRPKVRGRSVSSAFRMTSIDREVMLQNLPYASMEEEMQAMGYNAGISSLEQLHQMHG